MKLIKMKCENCGATLDVNKNLDKIHCNYCGAEILIDDEATELKRLEEVKLKARKENHEQSLKERQDIHEQKIKEKKEMEELNSVDNFKKGKLSKVLLIFAVICGILTFSGGFDFSSVIAFIQTILFIVAWLMGMKIVKEPIKKFHIILGIIGFALIIPYISTFGGKDSSKEKPTNLDISNLELKDFFPIPEKLYGRIETDRKDLLIIEIVDITKQDYKSYINEKVVPFGYDLDLEYENWDTVYGAFNKEGYSIRISYLESDNYMNITLESPEDMKEVEWPQNGLGGEIPKPKSMYGRISWDNDESFIIHVGKTSIEDYNEYVKNCENDGYTIERSKSEKSFRAKNKKGYEIHLMYIGGNVMEISVSNSTAKEDASNSNIIEEKPNKDNGLRKDFKNAMDSYEKFMDEYISFMKKYANSDGTDMQMLKDYSTFMERYNKAMEDFEKWDDEDLSDSELKYYLEVQNRVNKKLLEVH